MVYLWAISTHFNTFKLSPRGQVKQQSRENFAQIINKYGKIRSPCRRPQEGVIDPIDPPLIKTLKEVEWTQSMTQLIQVWLKPTHVKLSQGNPI